MWSKGHGIKSFDTLPLATQDRRLSVWGVWSFNYKATDLHWSRSSGGAGVQVNTVKSGGYWSSSSSPV